MKKLGVVLLVIAMAIGVMGGGYSIASLAEVSAEKTPADFASAENLALDTDELLDTYSVEGTGANRPYPDDWGMKFGKAEAGYYTRLDNEGKEPATLSAAHTAAYMPMSRSVAGTAAYYVSADITIGTRVEYGGLGIIIGEGTDEAKAPVGVWYCVDSQTLWIAAGGNDFLQAIGTDDGEGNIITGVELAVGETFTLGAVVDGQNVSAYIDGEKVGSTYTLADTTVFAPRVGAAMKNYNGQFENFVFKTLEEEPEVTPAEFADADNLFVDTAGLVDTYEVTNIPNYRPFPPDYGMKFAKTADGYYTRVNNSMEDFCASGANMAAYLATSMDISGVNTYYVSAEITVGAKADWGGLGIIIGEGEGDNPVGLWYCVDTPGLFLASDGYEYTNAFGTQEGESVVPGVEFEVGDTFTIAAVVDGQKISAYIDGVKIGETYTLASEFTPAIGADVKQYYSEYRDFTFKTLDTGLQAAEYTVTCISGAVEIGTIDYTYGDGATLAPIEREGYEFMGWHLLPDLSDPVIESIDAAIGGNITVYCEYKVANYSITYYDGDTKIENDDWDQSYTMSQYIPLPEAEDMAKEGYTFDGWYTTPDFSGDPVTAIEMGSTGDKVFYAKYTAVGGGDAGGCSGSVIGVSSGIIGLCALGAVAVMIKRKKAGGR